MATTGFAIVAPMTDYLASGFARVDESERSATLLTCLRRLGEQPFLREYKARSIERLGLAPGRRALEVAAGLGDEAAAMAAAGCRVVAVDLSALLCAETRKRLDGRGITLRADGMRLPLADLSVDAARVDRSLQHMDRPAVCILEMARVLRGGGRLVAIEPDWGTITLAASDGATNARMLDHWARSFPSPWIGRQLQRHFIDAGMVGVQTEWLTWEVRDLALADQIFDLCQTGARAGRAGVAGRAAIDDWWRDLEERQSSGRFRCALIFAMTSGKKAT